MPVTVELLEREFKYHGMTLPDPDPTLSVEEVQRIHAAQYPELTNAKPMIENAPTKNGYRQQVTFTVPAGTKG